MPTEFAQVLKHIDARADLIESKVELALGKIDTKMDKFHADLYHPDEGVYARAKKAVHTANNALLGVEGLRKELDDHAETLDACKTDMLHNLNVCVSKTDRIEQRTAVIENGLAQEAEDRRAERRTIKATLIAAGIAAVVNVGLAIAQYVRSDSDGRKSATLDRSVK